MDFKSSLFLGTSIIVASLILGYAVSRPAPPQSSLPLTTQPAFPPPRFQLITTSSHAYVFEPATGQIWESLVSPNSGRVFDDFYKPKIHPPQQP